MDRHITDDQVELDSTVLDQLYQLGQGTGALVCSVIEAFQRSLPVYMSELRAGVAAQDAEAVRMAAHALKSSASNLGAVAFAAQCQVLEHQARDEDLGDSEENLTKVELLLDPLNVALDKEHESASQKTAA